MGVLGKNVIPNWCGIGYHCCYHYWIPGSDLYTRPRLVFTLHKVQACWQIKFEKFNLSFMIAWVNLSSNGGSVSRNVCQRLCALPQMHRSIYFPNLRSKPKVMCTPSYAPVYLLSKFQIQDKGYVHSLICTGLSTFQISDPSLLEGGAGDRIWGLPFVLMRLSTNICIT
jgi:hypothetical protein